MIPRELFKQIRRLEIRTKGLVNNVFGGEYHSAFKGRGIEFSEVRPYQIGDDIRSIDWNVSARSGDTYVKIFEEEREQTLMLAVDVSASKNFGTRIQLKRDMTAEICALLAFSAIKNNDKVGLLLFSTEVEVFVPPKKGRTHVLRLVRDLFMHESRSSGTNIEAALDHVLHVLRRRSIVILLSDFMDTGYEKKLRAVGRRHDTVAVQIHDPREEELPPVGLISLTDAETGESVVVDAGNRQVRRLFARNAAVRQQELDMLFRDLKLDSIRVSTEEGYIDPLIRFFRHRTQIS